MNLFDEAAKRWDEKPGRVENARLCGRKILELLPFRKDWKLLEVGAGTGLLTFFLAPFVSSVVAVDTSKGMLEVLEEKVKAYGLEGKVIPYHGTVDENFPYSSFDLCVIHMTLHHVKEPLKLLSEVHKRLRSGGFVVVSDLDKEDGNFHRDNRGVYHFGFSPEEVEALFKKSGFEPVAYAVANEIEKNGKTYRVFVAAGKREAKTPSL